MSPSTTKAQRQRTIDANTKYLDQTKALFDAFVAERCGFVKVAAPLYEKQESGQWAVTGCTCGKDDCPKKNWGKHPLGTGWQHHATTDWLIARQWLLDGFSLGVYPLPGSRIIGIDEDRDKALDDLFGGDDESLTVALSTCADTINSRMHLFMRVPDGYDIASVANYRWPGGDLLHDGLVRHFVMPNMLHPSGRRAWNGVTAFAEISMDHLQRLAEEVEREKEQQATAMKPSDPGWEVTEGGRHAFLLTQAAHLRNLGMDEQGIFIALDYINRQRCVPPKDEAEIRKIAKDYAAKESVANHPKITLNLNTGNGNGNGHGPIPTSGSLRTIASYAARRVDWLWEGWVPRSEPVILEGLGGEGKSTFVVDLMSRLSLHQGMPDGATNPFPGPVDSIYITGEDDPERILKPRFLATSADATRIHFWQSKFTIPDDLNALIEAIRSQPDVRLVFIDPLFSHIASKINTGSDNEVRTQIMDPLRRIAHALDVTVLIARHLNKKGGDDPVLRGSGSYGGLTGAARSVIQSISDPDDDDRERKVIGVIKGNYGKMKRPWVYRLEGVEVREDVTAAPIQTSRIAYLRQHDMFIDQIIEKAAQKRGRAGAASRTEDKHAQADRDLIDILQGGELKQGEVMDEMTRRGHSRDAVYGAKARCHIDVTRPGGNTGPYVWRLPGQKPGRQGSFTFGVPGGD